MYALDFAYFEKNGYEILEKFKEAEADLGFFTEFDPQCIYNCKERIEKYYSDEPLLLKREYKYLHSNMIDDFIDMILTQCMGILYK